MAKTWEVGNASFDLLYPQAGGGFDGLGDVADRLIDNNMDFGCLRRWKETHKDGPRKGKPTGRTLQALFNGYDAKGNPRYKTMVVNAPSNMFKDQWTYMDDVVTRVLRKELNVAKDIKAEGLTRNMPNAMGTPMIQWQSARDFGEATLSMDAIKQTNRGRGTRNIKQQPIPIIHGDFFYTAREIAVTRNSPMPLDDDSIEQTTNKCAILFEKLLLGTYGTYTYGGSSVYGLRNHPDRIAKVITAPTAAGWTPETLVIEVGDMIQSLQDILCYGPYGMWFSPAWSQYYNLDYSPLYPGVTVMERLKKTDDIKWWKRAQYLDLTGGFRLLLVKLSSRTISIINGMRFQTLQWDTHGGMQKNFKVMGIQVPHMRTEILEDDSEVIGIVDAAAA